MREQGDIRRYGAAVLRHWWWLTILAVVAAGLTFLVGLWMPETYTAAALVGIIDRSNVVAFDPRFLPIERDMPTFEPYPALASSDAVFADLLATLGDKAPGDGSMQALEGRLEAALAADKVLLRLSASAEAPEDAADLANAWAAVVVKHASALYEAMDAALIARYEERLGEARGELEAARQALSRHDAVAAEHGFGTALALAETDAQRLRAELMALRTVQADAQAIRTALDAEDGWDAGALARAVALLQERALHPQGTQLAEIGAAADPEGALVSVERLLAQRISEAEEALRAAEAELTALRRALGEETAVRDELALVVRQAEELVLLLSGQAELVRLAADDSRIQVQLTSPAAVPTWPSRGGVNPLAIGSAALTGLLLGTVLALFLADPKEASRGATSARS